MNWLSRIMWNLLSGERNFSINNVGTIGWLHGQTIKVKSHLTPFKKLRSKMGLTFKTKTIKFLRENTEIYLHDLGVGKDF